MALADYSRPDTGNYKRCNDDQRWIEGSEEQSWARLSQVFHLERTQVQEQPKAMEPQFLPEVEHYLLIIFAAA
jgi:hypothetical protein